MKRIMIRGLLAATLLLGFQPWVIAGDFVVIVNKQNNYGNGDDQAKKEVKRLFLKRQSSWSNGIKASPFALPAGSPGYNALLSGILEMTEAELTQHWLTMKQTTGQTPPREVSSVRLLAKIVGKKEGGFAVIEKSAVGGLPDTVTVLFEF